MGDHYRKQLFYFLMIGFAVNSFAAEKIPDIILSNYSPKKITPFEAINQSSSQTISAAAIQEKNTSSIGQLLQGINGIQTQDLYGDGSKTNISLRGFGDNAGNNTAILINGQSVVQPDLGGNILNTLPLSDIEKIEVLPASAGVLYGDQAVGGVINIITPKPEPNLQTVSAGWGSYNTQTYAATLSDIIHQNIGYRLSANYDQTQNYRDHNDRKQDNLNAMVDDQFDGNEADLQFNHMDQNLQFPGALTLNQWHQNPTQANNHTDFSDQGNNVLQADYTTALNPLWKLSVNTTASRLDGHGLIWAIPYDENRTIYSVHPQMIGALNIFHQSIASHFGMDLDHGYYERDFSISSYDADGAKNEYALYDLLTLPLTNRFDLTGGVRAAKDLTQSENSTTDRHDHYQAAITHLETTWHFTPTLSLFLRRAGSYRFPNVDEITLTQNNQKLLAQTGVSYETGLDFKNARDDLKMEGYQLNLQHEILFVPSINNPLAGYNQNLAPTRRTGLILSDDHKLTEDWDVSLNDQLVNAKFNSGLYKNNRIPFVAEHTFQLSSNYRFLTHWQLYADVLYLGNRYPSNDLSNTIRLGGYSIYNANISYQIKSYTIALRCNNLLNKVYSAYSLVAYDSVSKNLIPYFYPAPDRNFSLTVSADF